jgi:hypothetical protein
MAYNSGYNVKSINKAAAKNTKTTSFKSIHEFDEFINKTPLNNIFRWQRLASTQNCGSWTGTKDYPEAVELLKNGWADMSKKLEQRLKVAANEIGLKKVNKMSYDVAGFQASVPRYLQGIPTNMISKKTTVQKQKVVTLVKNVGYNAMVSEDEIIESSIKAFQIVKAIEEKGVRVNLDICWASETSQERVFYRVRLKGAAERLNISKMAFPMVNPGMLRRLFFRMLEVDPQLTSNAFTGGYGKSLTHKDDIQPMLKASEYCLPSFIQDIDQVLNDLNIK